jgi:hypothetical protein
MKRVLFSMSLLVSVLISQLVCAEPYISKSFPSGALLSKALYGDNNIKMELKIIGKIKSGDHYQVFAQIGTVSPFLLQNPEVAVGGREVLLVDVYKTDNDHWIVDKRLVNK